MKKQWAIITLALMSEVFAFGLQTKTYYVFIDGEFSGFQSAHSGVLNIPDEDGYIYTVIAYGDTVLTGTKKLYRTGHITFRPNPFDGALSIDSSEETQLRIYDVTGKEIMGIHLEIGENHINLDLPAGVYFWRSNNESGKFVRIK